jgi:predicted dehydrogenase
MGIVGTGFIGPHHIDAVRRLGFVDVVAIAEMNDALAKAKCEQLGVPKAYGSYEAMLNDPDVQVIHNTTPNYLHYPINKAIIAKGKHVVSDKPLALTADQARELRDLAATAGVVNAVTFSYRGNPLVQQMRHSIASGKIGTPKFVFGHYPRTGSS